MRSLFRVLRGSLCDPLTLLSLGIVGCGTASATARAETSAVAVACTASSCKITWYFHAVGPVPAIIATLSVTGTTFLRTDTLPATATEDTATVAVSPGGGGLACARSSTAPTPAASCKSWTAPGAIVTDSVVVGIQLWPGPQPILASHRQQFCLFSARPAGAGSAIRAPTDTCPAIRSADRGLRARGVVAA